MKFRKKIYIGCLGLFLGFQTNGIKEIYVKDGLTSEEEEKKARKIVARAIFRGIEGRFAKTGFIYRLQLKRGCKGRLRQML